MKVEIWHYPRCSKSRQTLALLEARGLSPEVRLYREDPPDAATLERVLTLLDKSPRELMRRKEEVYTLLNLDDDLLSREELVGAMAEHPELIERPVVIADGRAALGRPPEAVLALFDADSPG